MEAKTLLDLSSHFSPYPALLAYASCKYAYLYYSPSPQQSRARSTAGLIVSYLQYERSIGQQPIATALGMVGQLDELPNVCLGSADFEKVFKDLIDTLQKYLEAYFPENSEPDYMKLCSFLQVCITVLKPDGESAFKKETFWSIDSLNTPYPHLTLAGFTPYPVLIPWKFAAFLANGVPIQYSCKCRFSSEEQDAQPSHAVEVELRKQTEDLMVFTEQLLARYAELIESHQLDSSYSSSELGTGLRDLLAISRTLIPVKSIFPAAIGAREAVRINSMLGRQALTRFTQPCSIANCLELRDIGLNCGHNYCNAHFVQQMEAARTKGRALVQADSDYTALLCSLCRQPVQTSCLRNYSVDMYERLVAEGENHRGVAICSVCAQTRPNRMVFRPACKQSVCIICTQEGESCCLAATAEACSWTQTLLLSCDSCQGVFPGVNFAPSPCEFAHILCQDCSFRSLKLNQCVTCQIYFHSSDLSLLRAKAWGQCQVCNENKKVEHFLSMPCACLICTQCGIKLTLMNGTCEACWMDNTVFPASLREDLAAISDLEHVAKCHFCCRMYPIADIELTCGHCVHSSCLILHASDQLFKEPEAERIYCTCGIEVLGTLVPRRLPRPDHPRIKAFLEANCEQIEVHCKKCGVKDSGVFFSVVYNSPIKNTCSNCNRSYCALCLEEWEEALHGRGACTQITARQKLRALELKGYQAVQCPYCRLAHEKGSAWQQCECKCYFCADCAARYDVVKEHGLSYHRPDCPSWKPEVLDAEFNESCSVCQIVGGDKACDPPRRLVRKAQFASFELAFH